MSIEENRFAENVVKEYLSNKTTFKKYDLRHYSQLETAFNPEQMVSMLKDLEIPITNTRATIVGGYTGQFAISLRNIGMKVIFTDPMSEWVRNASHLGFESFKYTAEEIPRNLMERTEVFATFECYPVFCKANYTTLRFLTSEYGILFGESKFTRDEMREDGCTAGLKRSFGPFTALYSINADSRTMAT